MLIKLFTIMSLVIAPFAAAHSGPADEEMHWASFRTETKELRTAVVNEGVSIESYIDGISYGFGTPAMIAAVEKKGIRVLSSFPAKSFRNLDFPAPDASFHNYAELNQELERLAAAHPGLVHLFSIGRTVEGREIRGVRINPNASDGFTTSALPGALFMGGHHAREHLSIEIPLLLAKHLAENFATDATVRDLLNRRDVFIIPMVNPDGAEYDIASGSYQMWRKNRKTNSSSARCPGVDLNRNYSFKWGTGGSSTNACSETFMGPQPFSEPETRAMKTFIEANPNIKVLLTFHTFSELVLYPWGHTYDPIKNSTDQATFERMARTMAGWNGYTPQQTSDLYIASGDTTDWAYGTLGIFSFTFELSPKDDWTGGGFYPGAGAIQPTFQANLRPALYLIDLADNPHRSVLRPETTLFYGR